MNRAMGKKILLYECEGFLEEILRQTNHEFLIDADPVSSINDDVILVINNANFKDQSLNLLAHILPVIIIGTTKLQNLNPHIKIVPKPIVISELLALLNKAKSYAAMIAPRIWLNASQGILIHNIKELSAISLTSTETKLMQYLSCEGQSKTKNEILKNVFGYKSSDTNTLETHLSRLRKKIEPTLTITSDRDGAYRIHY